ncbi:MAG: transglycosylase SLT domain-containing protein [Actinomycetota bacterium]|nr:transglycosylase SLT domain-containing protein [Actinomycetota bacterium]
MIRLLFLIIALALPVTSLAVSTQIQAISTSAPLASNAPTAAISNSSNMPATVSNAACLPAANQPQAPALQQAGATVKSSLQNAAALFKAHKWAEAGKQFGAAAKEYPVIGDYALFYQARALKQINQNDPAIKAAQELISKYPKSPLLKKARWMVVALTNSTDAALVQRLQDYVSRYPWDQRANMQLALTLKAQGHMNQASVILEKLYVSAGRYSARALAGLGRAPTAAESLVRIGSLLRAYRPHQAEAEARSALARQDTEYASMQQSFLTALAQALFMEKRYVESAGVFLQANDNYDAARAYFRAGDDTSFGGLLNGFLASGDKRAAKLLLALASRKRREHKPDEAISLLDMVRKKYPGYTEDALWENGWLYYTQHDYKDALDVFTKLAADDPKPVYLYWKARSIENFAGPNSASEAKKIYRKLSGEEDFYGILAAGKLGRECKEKHSIFAIAKEEKNPLAITRAGMLLKAGLRNDAMLELASASSRISDPVALVEIALKLEQLGAFRRAILVAERVPDGMQPKDILYPKAFWAPVKKSCAADNLDPYLLLSVMREESRFDPDARSQAGALGLMQLMPKVARRYGRALSLNFKTDNGIYDVDANIEIGAYYLKKFISGFKSVPEALAAYNAGKNAVGQWLAAGNYTSTDEFIEDIPFDETKNYVKRIITSYYEYGGRQVVEDIFSNGATGIENGAAAQEQKINGVALIQNGTSSR